MPLFRTRVLIMTTMLVAAGCRTTSGRTGSAVPEAKVEPASPITPARPPFEPKAGHATAPAAPECPAPDIACPKETDPVLCSAGSYNGRPVPDEIRLMVWAASTCLGWRDLAQAACADGLLPSKLGQVQCVPNPSAGRCPPPAADCPATGAPMRCSAGAYGNQKLADQASLAAAGETECEARAALAVRACRQNLDPALVQDVVCRPAPTGAECPPKPVLCDDPPRAATCKAMKLSGKRLDKPLEAKAATACAAKQELARQACKAEARPSSLDEITCVFSQ